MRELTCILCPNGCLLFVSENKNKQPEVHGSQCKRGDQFALDEVLDPKRTITGTIKTIFPEMPQLPVKTDGEVPLFKVKEVYDLIKSLRITKLYRNGELIASNVLGMDVNVISTSDMQLYIDG